MIPTFIVLLNLNGGPSKKAQVKSSLAVATRKGRVGLYVTELTVLLWADISPTEEPESQRKHAPNLQKVHKIFKYTESTNMSMITLTIL